MNLDQHIKKENTPTFKKIFILDNVNELQLHDRREILQMIYNSPSRSKLTEKGSGTQIKLEEIPDSLIGNIYEYMNKKLNEQNIELSV